MADTSGDCVSVAGLPPTVDIDAQRGTVTVAAGMRYGELATRLHAAGHALRNLGPLPHSSVAGACAAGTQGSGDGNRNLAATVSGMQLIAADGDLVTLSRDADGDLFGSVWSQAAHSASSRV
jgi:xylitol oxidase